MLVWNIAHSLLQDMFSELVHKVPRARHIKDAGFYMRDFLLLDGLPSPRLKGAPSAPTILVNITTYKQIYKIKETKIKNEKGLDDTKTAPERFKKEAV